MQRSLLLAGVLTLSLISGCSQFGQPETPPALPEEANNWRMFDGVSGRAFTPEELLRAMDDADIIVLGESHTDAAGHEIQTEIIRTAALTWRRMTLGLEEFDRSQQQLLDEFADYDLTGEQLRAERNFVSPQVRDNWMVWNLPKLEAARDNKAKLLATNAPLKYSRMVRDLGCAYLPDLEEEEADLFECPSIAEDPAYKDRFAKRLSAAIRSNKSVDMKPLQGIQIDRMFRAHRVWDATMADSLVEARRDGARKIIHVVGNFHSDYDGGLIKELRFRAPEANVLVISLNPRRSDRLRESDLNRADIVIYTRG